MSSETRPTECARHHYEVEKELAARLRSSTREERTELFKSLYSELFVRVPDHPRLLRRDTEGESRDNIAKQMRLLTPYLNDRPVLLEFAPGDCRLSFAAARSCEKVIGVDISDQRASGDSGPENFQLIVYDGYHLDIPDQSVDIVFSYQFLEHLHPEDVNLHFETVYRLLKPGGVYVFDTPHRFSGPHDISREFGKSLDCFHFQEWTYREMRERLRGHGFGEARLHRRVGVYANPLLNALHDGVERVLSILPEPLRRAAANRLFLSVALSAIKESPAAR